MFIRKITKDNSNVQCFSNEAGFKNIVCCCGGEKHMLTRNCETLPKNVERLKYLNAIVIIIEM